MTKREALALGLKSYESDKPCKHGHIGLRFMSNSECCTCAKERGASKEAKAKRKIWRKTNRDKINLQKKHSYLRNKTSVLNKCDLYRADNKDKLKKYFSNYKKQNVDKVRALGAKRKAEKLKRTPKWVGEEELWLINEAYELAALREKQTGFKWHVDHVIPLLGKTVSGLHTPQNLQVIPWIDNLKKANSYEAA